MKQTKNARAQFIDLRSKGAQSYVGKKNVLKNSNYYIYFYAAAATIMFLVVTVAYLRQTIELIGVSSKLRNVQRQEEAMIRTCGGFPNPAYVCYGAPQKDRLEALLDGRL